MPFSSVLGASSVIKPGVCTSTTRPTVPFEGQLIYETDTDMVAAYNGSAWVYTHSSGLVRFAGADFSAAASLTVDNCFTSSYTNYRLMFNFTGAATASPVIQLRVGGVTAATNYQRQRLDATGTQMSPARTTAQPSLEFGVIETDFRNSAILEILQPAQAQFTNFYMSSLYTSGASTTDVVWLDTYGLHSAATAYDGFIVSFGTNATGTYTLYGYGK